MTYEDTANGVREMFLGITDLPDLARVEQIGPGEWRAFFTDGSEATAYPLEVRFESDPATVKQRPF